MYNFHHNTLSTCTFYSVPLRRSWPCYRELFYRHVFYEVSLAFCLGQLHSQSVRQVGCTIQTYRERYNISAVFINRIWNFVQIRGKWKKHSRITDLHIQHISTSLHCVHFKFTSRKLQSKHITLFHLNCCFIFSQKSLVHIHIWQCLFLRQKKLFRHKMSEKHQ